MLCSGSETDALELIRCIRSGANIESVIHRAESGDMLAQLPLQPSTWSRFTFPLIDEMPAYLKRPENAYLKSLAYRYAIDSPPQGRCGSHSDAELPYLIPYSAAELIEPRLGHIVPSKWTSVPVNDHVLRQLLHSYFLFEYPGYAVFHKDHFLDDMLSGRRRFCSPILVNAVLAAGCVSRDNTKNRGWPSATI
jgi:hypothetical protein